LKIHAGTHYILELFSCPPELLDHETFISEAIRQTCATSVLSLLNRTCHKFTPQGVTALGLLSESHISIHTWPEHGYAAVDIFTCNEGDAGQVACDNMIECFRPGRVSLRVLERGDVDHQPGWSAKFMEDTVRCRAHG